MPVIREYRSQVAMPTGESRAYSDPGAAAREGIGLAEAGQAISGVGDIFHKIAVQKDQSTLQAETAKARADLTDSLFQSVQDGSAGASDFHAKFGEQVAARTTAIQDKMATRSGKSMASAYSADLSAQFQTQVFQAQAQAAGKQAVQNYGVALDANQRTLANDPSQYAFVLKDTLVALTDPTGPYANIPAAKRQELIDETRQKLALSAIQGTIRNVSPEYAKQLIEKGIGPAEGLSPEAGQAMLNMADTHIRAREVEDSRLEAQKERAKRDEQEATLLSFVAKMNTPQGNTLTVKEVLNSNLNAAQQEHILGMIKELSSGRAVDNPVVVNRLFNLVHLPSSDPNKITKEEDLYPYVGRGLGIDGLQVLRREMKLDAFGGDVNNAMNTADRMASRSIYAQVEPDKAAEAVYRIRRDLGDAIEKYKQAGKDPRLLITPPTTESPNPDYFLTPARMQTYLQSSTGLVASQVAAKAAAAQKAAEKAKNAKPGDKIEYEGKEYVLNKAGNWIEVPK